MPAKVYIYNIYISNIGIPTHPQHRKIQYWILSPTPRAQKHTHTPLDPPPPLLKYYFKALLIRSSVHITDDNLSKPSGLFRKDKHSIAIANILS